MKKKILIIEDEKIMRVTLEDALRSEGYEVTTCEAGIDGITAYKGDSFDLVVTDVRLLDINGIGVLRRIREADSEAQVLIMTAFGTIKDAVDVMKMGAFDYITKPFSLDEFSLIVKRALEVKDLRKENVRLRKDLSACYCFPNVIGESDVMRQVFDLITRTAQTDSTVLILGESGTGKELVASIIHYQGPRKDKPFVKVNCAALPDNLIESELFGYEKGAFTGAAKRKPGRFEMADGGTIFLDEIGDLPPQTQVKLLRVLQDGTFDRLGGTDTITTDVRIIAATNRDIEKAVKDRSFREDLYYRLNVIPVHVPLLRQRRDDIPLLIEHFLQRYTDRFRKEAEFDESSRRILMEYDYPGNVRELENIVERCVALSAGKVITTDDLPPHLIHTGDKGTSRLTLSEVKAEAEKEYIVRVLQSTKWNRTRTAEILGISRKTLWEKINTLGIKY
ncbi:transcriptional regulatory protein ZraR [bacterium BMS3Bbin05]|nr:transcriptional regulatory protein ZraR [bacterium BMS3Bbin05]